MLRTTAVALTKTSLLAKTPARWQLNCGRYLFPSRKFCLLCLPSSNFRRLTILSLPLYNINKFTYERSSALKKKIPPEYCAIFSMQAKLKISYFDTAMFGCCREYKDDSKHNQRKSFIYRFCARKHYPHAHRHIFLTLRVTAAGMHSCTCAHRIWCHGIPQNALVKLSQAIVFPTKIVGSPPREKRPRTAWM